jgi:hypothetical protein
MSRARGLQVASQGEALEDFSGTSFPFDVEDAPWSLAEWLPLLTVIVLTAVFLPPVVRFLRRSNGGEVATVAEACVEPNARADMELRLLALQQLPSESAVQCSQFLEQAAEALRRYLIEQWDFPADRQTSEESLQAWQQTELDEASLCLLLELCDGTKFAQRQANKADVEAWLGRCRNFVEVGQ